MVESPPKKQKPKFYKRLKKKKINLFSTRSIKININSDLKKARKVEKV